jgi:hypothetical protein
MSTPIDPNLLQVDEDRGWIPEGFVFLRGPDGEQYIVPDLFVPALRQSLESYQVKKNLDIKKAAGTVGINPRLLRSFSLGFLSIHARNRGFGRILVRVRPLCYSAICDCNNLFFSSFFFQDLNFLSPYFEVIGEGKIMAPTYPVSFCFCLSC